MIQNHADAVFYNVCSVLADGQRLLELYQYDIHEGTMRKVLSQTGAVDFTAQQAPGEQGQAVTGYGGTGFDGLDIEQIAFDENGFMYTFAAVTGNVYRYELSTGDCREIYQAEGYGFISYDGQNLYLMLSDPVTVQQTGCRIVVIDTQGNELEKLFISYGEDRMPSAFFGDKRGLFVKFSSSPERAVHYVFYDKQTGEAKRILERPMG